MGLEVPKRARKLIIGVLAGSAVLFLSGCSVDEHNDVKRLAMPVPATKEAQGMFDLWLWAWLAAIITGVAVWGLIFYCVVRFRRRTESEIPVQTRYNLPIEIFYTVAPVMMVIVFFFFTVHTQDKVLYAPKDLHAANAEADLNVTVVGQKWSWSRPWTPGTPTRAGCTALPGMPGSCSTTPAPRPRRRSACGPTRSPSRLRGPTRCTWACWACSPARPAGAAGC